MDRTRISAASGIAAGSGASLGAGSTFTSPAVSALASSSSTSLLKKASFYGTDDRIVLDIGTFAVRAGFSGERTPRQTVVPCASATEHSAAKGGLAAAVRFSADPLDEPAPLASVAATKMVPPFVPSHEMAPLEVAQLQALLRSVFQRSLLTDAKLKRIIVCESPFAPVELKRQLAMLLFHRFGVKSISFIPGPFAALLATGHSVGLVVDCGHNETTVLPIYDNMPLLAYAQTVPLGGRAISERLRMLVREHGVIIEAGRDVPREPTEAELKQSREIIDGLGDTFWESLKTRIVVAPAAAAVERAALGSPGQARNVQSSGSIEIRLGPMLVLHFPDSIRQAAVNVLFEGDDEGRSLQSCVIDAVFKCPIAIRNELMQNVLATGGTFSIPGLQELLRHQIERLGDDPLHMLHKARRLAYSMNFIYSPFQPSLRAWVGGKRAVKMQASSELTREDFIANGTVPDWTNIPPPVEPAPESDSLWSKQAIKDRRRSHATLAGSMGGLGVLGGLPGSPSIHITSSSRRSSILNSPLH
nr:Actin- protein 10 [Polyrhizophydium stewartii]